MKAFAFARPATLAEALKLLSPAARPKGGGNDLLDLAKRGVSTPETIVDLGAVSDGAGRAIGGEGPPLRQREQVHVGARATLASIAASPLVREKCPALSDAAAAAATPQIRNTATAAGNLLQRPRCAYFRDPFFDCRKRGGTSCPAIEGVHDDMAIFRNAACCAVHPSNLATAIVALAAEVQLAARLAADGSTAGRSCAADSWFVGPDEDPLVEARIAPGELVTAIVVPVAPVSAYVEVDQKQSYDWPSVACAVALDVEAGRVREARVALGAVAPVPFRAKAAEDAMRGKSLRDEAAWSAAADAATQGATPLPRNGHKVRQLRAVVRRAIAAAAARAR